MVKRSKKQIFLRIIVLAVSIVTLVSCSIGTSFRVSDIRTFKGTIIPELSSEPILIEKISTDLVKKEKQKESLNLPLNLLNYSPDSYKVGAGDVLFIYVYGVNYNLFIHLSREIFFFTINLFISR